MQVISRFPLRHEEIVARRKLLWNYVDRSSTRPVSSNTVQLLNIYIFIFFIIDPFMLMFCYM